MVVRAYQGTWGGEGYRAVEQEPSEVVRELRLLRLELTQLRREICGGAARGWSDLDRQRALAVLERVGEAIQ